MADDIVIIEPGDAPVGSVIWLHGLGADGHDFEPIVPELRLPSSLPLRFVFPHAPVRPVTINGGMAMRAWFDILSLERTAHPDTDGIEASCARLEALVDAEMQRGIAAENILLAGFSQGGVIAMHVALRSRKHFRGLMVLSSYLPLADRLPGYPAKPLPVFMAHGQYDPMLPLDMGHESRDALEAAGFDVEWHEYPMAHAVCAEEIRDISEWFARLYTEAAK